MLSSADKPILYKKAEFINEDLYEEYIKNKQENIDVDISPTFDINSNLSFISKDALNSLTNLHDASKMLEQIIITQIDRNKEKNNVLQRLNYYSTCSTEVTTDLTNYSVAYNKLNMFNTQNKKAAQALLENDLNTLVNGYFDNDYIFKFKSSIDRNKLSYSLDIENRRGAIYMVIGGAGRQLAGIVINLAILNQKQSTFLFLDEAFNSFGVKEIVNTCEFINSAPHMQFVLVEHKKEMQNIMDCPKIYLNRTLQDGAYIQNIEDKDNELETAMNYIQDAFSRVYDNTGNAYRLICDNKGKVINQVLIK